MSKKFKPQPGFQTEFAACSADIAFGGGAAGVGKTFSELLEPLYHISNPLFNNIIFRRTSVQIRNPGGLWDKSQEIYRAFGAKPLEQPMLWTFPSGAIVKFSHLEHESNIYDHQGTEYCCITFDELTHFTRRMFFYLMSRNRSMCGVKPYMRATCNPDPDSWVAEFIEWYIDQETGYAIPERAGVIRYFTVDNDNVIWGDTKQEVIDLCPHMHLTKEMVLSFTFIPGDIYQNKKLLEIDPGYIAKLQGMPEEEKLRLLGGNWKVRTDALSLFEYSMINHMFENEMPASTSNRYMTIDAARFGQDFLTCFIWFGWKVVKLLVLTKCDAIEAHAMLEKERLKFNIIKGHVIVDQDGVGAGIVKLGSYIGFSGGHPPIEVREVNSKVTENKNIKEWYVNRKTQFYYRFAEKVNMQEVSMCLNAENVVIDYVYGVKLKLKGKVVDVRELIKADFRAIKKLNPDNEGKKRINSKEEQKIILKGRSPDFADGASLRIQFDLKSGTIATGTGKSSILDQI